MTTQTLMALEDVPPLILHEPRRPMFPHVIDSTMLAAFRACGVQMFRTYIEHWKPQKQSIDLIAGKAFAEGVEVAREAFFKHKTSAEQAVALGLKALILAYGDAECPPENPKSLPRVAGALEYYFEQYPLGADGATPLFFADGKHGIEWGFLEPLPFPHPITGNPILFSGRADMIADWAGGRYMFDEKTTKSLGASWADQWDMRSQFTGYSWVARRNGIPVDGVVVRGVSILKTKYETQQVPCPRTPWEEERWLRQVIKDLNRMVESWNSGEWDYNLDSACNYYGGCKIKVACKAKEPENWLPVYFEKRVWDPISREEISVKEWEESWGHEHIPDATTQMRQDEEAVEIPPELF